MISLIAADMDGTLLDEKGKMPVRFPEIFRRLDAAGILFAVASGRQYNNLLERFYEFRDKVVFIAENGTYVVYKGKNLYSSTIPMLQALELVHVGKSLPHSAVVLCGERAAYVETRNEPEWPAFLTEIRKYYASLAFVKSFTDVRDGILKVTVCTFKGSEEYALPVFEQYGSRFKLTISGRIWLDITMPEANKGVALAHIQDNLGISREQTMAFGDFLNDVELLQNAGYSYAMENAHPDLFQYAKYTAGPNNRDGVLRQIEHMLDFPSEYQ